MNICWTLFWLLAITEAKIEIPYEECDSNFCFGFSAKNDDCVEEKNCKMFVIIRLEQSEDDEFDVQFIFSAYMTNVKVISNSVWMAVGLSDDQEMGDDAVVDCYTVGTKGAQSRSSMNLLISRMKSNQHVDKSRVSGVWYLSKSFVDGTLSCEWRRAKYSNITGQDRDPETFELIGKLYEKSINFVDKNYFVMLAHGVIIPGSLSKKGHTPKARAVSDSNPFFNIFFVNCEETASVTSKYCFGIDILKDGTLKPCIQRMRCHIIVIVKKVGNENLFRARISDISNVQIEDSSSGVYLSVGLSFDTKMGEDSVTECLFFANGSNAVIDTFNKEVGSNMNTDITITNSGTAILFDDVIECGWKRPFEVQHNGIDFSTQKHAFYLLIAAGELGSEDSAANGKRKHTKTFASLNPIIFGDFVDNTDKDCDESSSIQCFGFREIAPAQKTAHVSSNADRCITEHNCLLRLRIERVKNIYRFTAIAHIGFGYWMAFALSTDDKMGDDMVFQCAATSNGTSRGVSWNTDKSNINAEIADGINEKEIVFDKNKLICTFEVNVQFSILVDGANKTISLEKDEFEYTILFAYGKVIEDSGKGFHKEKHGVYSKGAAIAKFHHVESKLFFEKKSSYWLFYITVILAFIIIVAAVILVFYIKKKPKQPKSIQSAPVPMKNDEPSIETIESLRGEKVSKPAKTNTKSMIASKTVKPGTSLNQVFKFNSLVTSKSNLLVKSTPKQPVTSTSKLLVASQSKLEVASKPKLVVTSKSTFPVTSKSKLIVTSKSKIL